MLTRHAACDIVLKHGWLRHTPIPFRSTVLDRCLLEEFAGTPVYAIDDDPGGMYGLVEGGLGISMAPRERGPYTAHFAMPGTWFGEIATFTRHPRRVGLTTTRPTTMLHLPLHAIDEIVGRDLEHGGTSVMTIGQLDVAIGGSERPDDPQSRQAIRGRSPPLCVLSPRNSAECLTDRNRHQSRGYRLYGQCRPDYGGCHTARTGGRRPSCAVLPSHQYPRAGCVETEIARLSRTEVCQFAAIIVAIGRSRSISTGHSCLPPLSPKSQLEVGRYHDQEWALRG